jgi:hypothetical protein
VRSWAYFEAAVLNAAAARTAPKTLPDVQAKASRPYYQMSYEEREEKEKERKRAARRREMNMIAYNLPYDPYEKKAHDDGH